MNAELAEVRGRSARWRFARSSARAALRLPMGGWPALALVAGVAAVVAAAVTVEAAVPGLGVFAVSFVGLVGAMVVLAVARSRRVWVPVPAATVLVAGGVAAAITMTVAFLLRDPATARYLPPARAVFLAAVLAGCLWIAVAVPRSLGGSRLAAHLGVGAAVVLVVGQLLLMRAAGHDSASSHRGSRWWTWWRPCGSGSGRSPSSWSPRARLGRPGGRSARACRPASGRASPPCRSPTPFGCTRRCACTPSTAGCCGSATALPKGRT
jgi:hypothetical protein